MRRVQFDGDWRLIISYLFTVHIQTDLAYGMAEHHHQYAVLVEFSTDPVVGSRSKIEQYVEKYGEPFASVLYARYVDRGTLTPNLDLSDR